jgi:hypothetical protein
VSEIVIAPPLRLARSQWQWRLLRSRPGLALLIQTDDQDAVGMSRAFSMNSEFVESLTASVWCSCDAQSRQMRLIVLGLRSEAFAIDRAPVHGVSRPTPASHSAPLRYEHQSPCAAPPTADHPASRRAAGQKARTPSAHRLLGEPQCPGNARGRRLRGTAQNQGARVAPAPESCWGRRVQRCRVAGSAAVSVTGGIGRPARMYVPFHYRDARAAQVASTISEQDSSRLLKPDFG